MASTQFITPSISPHPLGLSNASGATSSHEEKEGKINQVAKSTFLHLTHALLWNGWVTTRIFPRNFHLIGITSSLALSLICSIGLVAKQKLGGATDSINTMLTHFKEFAHFSLLDLFFTGGINPMIHEGGHCAMAYLLFLKPEVQVKIPFFAFKGGNTLYTVSNGLTYFGRFLGKSNARACVAAGGIMASALTALFEFTLAEKIKTSYPGVSQFLNYHGCSQLLGDILYGFSAFYVNKNQLSHDLVHLWVMKGIHPAIPIAMMIGLPLCFLATKKLLEKRRAQALASM